MNEQDIIKEKKNKFKRLAVHRVDKAIHYIELIGNLSNKRDYEYSNEDFKKIKSALSEALKSMEERFSRKMRKSKFQL